MSNLINGKIPANTKCPFWDECGLKGTCHHKGENHDVPFSCGIARGFEIVKECKKNQK